MSRIQSIPGEALPRVAEPEKLALSIDSCCRLCSVGRTFLYQEIAAGRLRAVKAGRRTLIEAAEARRWLSSLERVPAAEARPGPTEDGRATQLSATGHSR